MYPPYIGITDFALRSEVLEMLEVFRSHRRPGSPRRLQVGAMMSYKTVMGFPTKWSGIYLSQEELQKVFSVNSLDVINCLHYVDYDNSLQGDHFLMYAGLLKMFEIAGSCPYLGAVQLDMVWPDPVLIAEMHKVFHGEFILQVGAKAVEMLDNDPEKVAWKVASYEGLVDRFLFDMSMGQGVLMDSRVLLPYMRQVREKCPDLTDAQMVVAGGIGPSTTHLLKPVLKEFPGISTDAQSRLRPSGNAMYPIDCGMVRDCIINQLELLENGHAQ